MCLPSSLLTDLSLQPSSSFPRGLRHSSRSQHYSTGLSTAGQNTRQGAARAIFNSRTPSTSSSGRLRSLSSRAQTRSGQGRSQRLLNQVGNILLSVFSNSQKFFDNPLYSLFNRRLKLLQRSLERRGCSRVCEELMVETSLAALQVASEGGRGFNMEFTKRLLEYKEGLCTTDRFGCVTCVTS